MRLKTEMNVGDVFGKWTVIEEPSVNKFGQIQCLCRCACGKERVQLATRLRCGRSKSCRKCTESDTRFVATHGMYGTKTYKIWLSMWARCTHKDNLHYKRYTEQGISVADRWSSFENFYADMGECPPGLTLDRIDSAGNYTPENCRWATSRMQVLNRCTTQWVTLNGQRMCIKDAAEHLDVGSSAILRYAKYHNISVQEAVDLYVSHPKTSAGRRSIRR